MHRSPFLELLEAQGYVVIDGGLATELEARGANLRDPLWSARLLVDEPERISDVHHAYLDAGADVIISASYQASVAGFVQRGLSERDAVAALERSVLLARSCRDAWWAAHGPGSARRRPLVAASIGPYGAYLHDGSEYRGRYGVSRAALREFHAHRLRLLANAGPDVLAIETIPSRLEAEVLAELVDELDAVDAWLAFSARDDASISEGEPIDDTVRAIAGSRRVVAIGVNCTAPGHVDGLLTRLRAATTRPLVVYPNAGGTYDAASGCWHGDADEHELADRLGAWRSAGAVAIGGCCRTTPATIRALRRRCETSLERRGESHA